MKRQKVITLLATQITELESQADEAGGYGLYADASMWSHYAVGMRFALQLLDGENNTWDLPFVTQGLLPTGKHVTGGYGKASER